MLTAFILNEEIKGLNKDLTMGFTVNPKGYRVCSSLNASLANVIKWALMEDEDVIFCISDHIQSTPPCYEKLESLIFDVVAEGIYFLYVEAEYAEQVIVNENYIAIDGISSVSSFILTRPIFKLALSILENNNFVNHMSWLNFLSILSPHAFAISENSTACQKRINFHIISPFRNAAKFLPDYVSSIQAQVSTNYNVYLIDDCSTDKGASCVKENTTFKMYTNINRQYALQNILNILLTEKIADDDVVCLVDADDRLPHKYVLNILQTIYQDESLLLTYGSTSIINEYSKWGQPYYESDFENIRKSQWKASHMRTFKYKVFKKFIELDPTLKLFRDKHGNLLRMPYDMAILLPLFELAGFDKTKFIYTPTYEYRLHSNNDHSINRKQQFDGEKEVRRKKGLKRYNF
ncbi:glycosyltransferase family A protein [Sphingobacterium griseoflavum]|uniref:Glycosyltransferase 2-like domain-containing protein n=1 Tax=Sphingobacterium griseoflavum TaxID=1474952 RepID=A0ABQ3HT13_9SPHI|nr:glycosyltransferase family A protein [Sphingobacterium griseoflavum]GHE31801.1 hypothetical protein GCM10017764_13680 [Sphingobacterium griseoflavum]